MRNQQSTLSRDMVQWLPLSGAVAWALTRDKQFTDRARRAAAKCFVGDNVVYAEDGDGNPAPEPYFDNAQAAWEQVCKEIANGKIKLDPPDWRVMDENWLTENWLTNGSVQVAYAELQSVFPQNGPKLLTSKLVGPPVRPSDVPDMSLTEIAYWIATEGGKVGCVISNVEEVWKPAFAELLKKIVNDDLDLWGRRHGAGLHEKIPGEMLADIRIDYPFQVWSEHVFSDDPHVECSGIGSSDNLFSGRQLQWSNLRVKSAEVARRWPFHPHPTLLTLVSKKRAREFVREYVSKVGAEATQAGLERAARAEGLGGRDRLRAAFRERMGPDAPKRGRPCGLK